MKVPESRAYQHPSSVRLRHIASTFLYIGLASFSLSALGEAKDQVTRKRRWFTDDEYMEGLGLAQLLPGAPTVNLSSYLGYRLRGLPGAVAATVSFLVPCFLLMLLLSHLYFRHGQLPVVAGLFHGLAALVVGLVLNTVLNLWRSGVKTPFGWLMALAGFAFIFWLKMHLVGILVVAGATSALVALLTRRFPGLGRWTEGQESVPTSAVPMPAGEQEEPGPSAVPEMSACSAMPIRLGLRHTAALIAWLALFLALDLFLIRSRPELMQMATRFLRIGALVFGSGYAMLPFIQNAVVIQNRWLTNEQFAVGLALSLATPGPVTIIGVFIGYKVGAVIGALAGVVNMYLPAWGMTMLVAGPYAQAGKLAYVRRITQGIVAAFIGTLLVVLIRLAHDTLVSIPTVALAAGAFVAQRFGKIATIWIVLVGAAVSMIVFGLRAGG